MRGDGAHGVVYALAGGRAAPHAPLQGRRVRGLFGGRGQFVAVVDAWELAWPPSRARRDALEHETVALGLKRDVRVQQVAFGAAHRVARTLDGHVLSWAARDAALHHGELGQVATAWHPVTLTPRSARADDEEVATAKAAIDANKTSAAIPEEEEEETQFEEREGLLDVASGCLPRRVRAPSELFFAAVACGAHHSVAVTDKGDVYAWGRNFEGQLGLGAATLPPAVDRLHHGVCAWPKYVAALLGQPSAVDVACGDAFTVVLLADGSVWRFGERVAGATRHPQDKSDARPRRLIAAGEDGAPFVGIAAGSAHALAVTKSGAAYSWGLNAYGQLGLGDAQRDSSETPRRVAGPTTLWAKVFAGGHYSAAVTSEGQLHTWGHGRHGQLGHSAMQCEFAPREVDALRGVHITSVVCDARALFAFAPTVVTAIAPRAGEVAGGFELRIRGSGFWASDDLTVRFVPLSEGRLPRGALARFDTATREVVCTVPKFSLPGEFAVEVAMDGKHFTTDGHVLEAFRRPAVVRVSRWEARLRGGDTVDVEVEGDVPRACAQPRMALVPLEIDACVRVEIAGSVVDVAHGGSPRSDNGGSKPTTTATATATTTRLRFVMPALASVRVVRCRVELSFNDGFTFAPISETVGGGPSSSLDASAPSSPFVLQFHEAAVARCRPNSFFTRSLPTTVAVAVRHLLAPSRDADGASQLSVALRITGLNVSDASVQSRVDVVLPVVGVQQEDDGDGVSTVTCSVPPLADWRLSKLDAKTQTRVEITTDWWKFVPRWGFEAAVRVSMNGGDSLLPWTREEPAPLMLCGVFALGKLLTAFPSTTPLTGGTAVAIAADYFHFDTEDAVVLLKWRDREVRVPATCTAMAGSSQSSAVTRRLTFTTPALPFPAPPAKEEETAAPPADATTTGSAAAAAQPPPPTDDAVGLVEEVDVLVSLDGRRFQRESPLRLVYCRTPALLEIAPAEAPPGTRMVVKVDKLPPLQTTSSGATATASVRLTTATLGVSTVVQAEMNESAGTVEFELPALPVADEDAVRVAFSLDGQQFAGGDATTRATATDQQQQQHEHDGTHAGELGFRYRAPLATVDAPSEAAAS